MNFAKRYFAGFLFVCFSCMSHQSIPDSRDVIQPGYEPYTSASLTGGFQCNYCSDVMDNRNAVRLNWKSASLTSYSTLSVARNAAVSNPAERDK